MVVRTTVDIPETLHDLLRRRAESSGASVRSLIVRAITEAYAEGKARVTVPPVDFPASPLPAAPTPAGPRMACRGLRGRVDSKSSLRDTSALALPQPIKKEPVTGPLVRLAGKPGPRFPVDENPHDLILP